MMDSWSLFIEQFHFLRPWWLLAFVPLFVLLLWTWQQHKNSQSWLKVIDAKLQPFVLTHAQDQQYSSPKWLAFLALLISVIALAGPVWQKLPQSVYKPQSALVIVLDLSRSMDAADIKPSRLKRAKLKIIDLLNARREGQSALVVYAAQAFTVSPLTDDNETIVALLNSLSTDIMPAQGSRMDMALNTATDLLAQAGIVQGHILVVSDGVTLKEFNAIKKLNITQHTISVLAVGTEQGAPINVATGGYLKDASGQIVVAKMNKRDLLSLAQATQGVFATLRSDDADIKAVLDLMSVNRLEQHSKKSDKMFDVWYEHGSWLLLLIIPMVLMVFRKGFLVLLVVVLMPVSQPVEADWQQWFKNDDQKAAERFKAGEFDAAGEQFKHPDWRAAAQYKNKQFDAALQHYEQTDDLYNKGNALAQMKRYEEALKAWDEVLKTNPKHEDAAYNKKQLEDFLKQQQEQQQDQDKQDQQQNKDDKDQQQQEDQQSKDSDQQQQSDQQQDQQQQSSDEQTSEEQKAQQQSEQQQSEEEKAKQEQSEQERQDAKQKEQEMKDAQADEKKDEQKTPEQLAAEEALKEQMNDPLDEKTKQWLRRVPDDPGGLMRNKFRYQYKQLNRQNNEQNPW